MTEPDHTETPARLMPPWFLWTIAALLAWGIWAVISKLIGSALTASQSQALSTLGLLPVMVALVSSKRLTVVSSRLRGIWYGLAAGALACAGNIAYYEALHRGEKAATVIPLTALYPVVTIALAVLFLRERFNRIQLTGVCLSLSAIYLFNVQRESGLSSAWLTFALLPILFWGTAGFFQKLSTNHISGELSTLWFLGAFIPVAVLIVVRESVPADVSARTWILVSALGFFFAVGNYALLAALAMGGKASVIVPLTGLYPLASVPLAIMLFGERVGGRETIGIALALAAVVALSHETPPAEHR